MYQLATIAEAETERTRRYRDADIDAERARWARLVPVGCAKGEHARLDRPGGAASCPDCGALFADDGWGEIPTEPITTTNKETYQ